MKFIFSFLFLLNCLCFQAQEKDSVVNSEIEDVVILKNTKIECHKIYEREKANYEVQSKELNKLNFETLFYEIFKLKELQILKSNNRKILIFNPDFRTVNSVCGNDFHFKCKHYEKDIQNKVFKKVWKKFNYLIIEKFFDDKVIIPLMGQPFLSFEQNMSDENNYLKRFDIKPSFIGIYQDLNNIKKEFHYSSHRKHTENLKIHLQKDRMIAEDFLQLDMSIFPVVSGYSNVYNVKIIIGIDGEELNRIDILYQYKYGKWNLLKENYP
ncbi:hypothetical protein SD427_14385 [Chryseobacterium sp. JJR-5R]|uniref:hypothetical protein n=1 Tax=Chryseobacterium sp. JJR-5R TaxID=3093923 RepID=UPI002A74BF2D|nr:hypothetical protein [Chryseobacterium sp. JJR-5R]WPO81948.1 hypothetical protein SD427_14385 [Chryseobacterium sp. JJR-5R]